MPIGKLRAVPVTASRAAPRPDMSGKPRAAWLPWAALLVVWFVWGSTYLAIRVGVETIPPLLLAAVRFLVAGAVLYPIAVHLGGSAVRAADRPGRRQWAAAAVVGTLLLTIGNGGLSYAEQTVPSGLAALLVATVPLWMVAADRLINGKPVGPLGCFSLVVGLVGVAILSQPGGPAGDLTGTFVLLAASASWGFGSVLSGRLPLPGRPLVGAAMQMLTGGAILFAASAARGELANLDLTGVSGGSAWALLYLIGPGSLLALSAYVLALQRLTTTTVSTYAYVNPVVAVLLGALLLHEMISGRIVVGAAVVVFAVALSLTARRKPEAA